MWIRRPNVLNRKLLGAVVLLENALSPVWSSCHLDPRELSHVTVGELQLQQEESDETLQSGLGRILVRKLLPRVKYIEADLELIVVGMERKLHCLRLHK